MRKKHRPQEKKMEAPQQINDDMADQATAEADTSNREAAALEEKLMAERVAQANMAGEDVVKSARVEPEPEMLVTMAAKGRDYLLEQMRQLQAKHDALPAYAPPPRTERQQAALELELAAGRRAQEKHAAQDASRPQPKPEKWDGTTAPVHRPGEVVPDPILAAGAFAAGTRVYGPNA